jgi:hypothetical protein
MFGRPKRRACDARIKKADLRETELMGARLQFFTVQDRSSAFIEKVRASLGKSEVRKGGRENQDAKRNRRVETAHSCDPACELLWISCLADSQRGMISACHRFFYAATT